MDPAVPILMLALIALVSGVLCAVVASDSPNAKTSTTSIPATSAARLRPDVLGMIRFGTCE